VNAEGYTESYKNLCVALSRTVSATTSKAIDALRGSSTSSLTTYDQFKKLAALTIIPEKNWPARYEEMKIAHEAIKAAAGKRDATGASSSNAHSASGPSNEQV
jgi:hypothetical protein